MTERKIESLDELYDSFEELSIEGGWHRKAPALWPEPRKTFLPYVWHYAEIKKVLDAAGPLVDHSMADRRNVTLRNPVEGNLYATVRTLVGAYQMIRPGEVALAHRHTPSALRIILEGHGTYTVVQGKRAEMRPGDVLLTPSWLWHSHSHMGNDGEDVCYWIDVLDVPLVHQLETMFFERYPGPTGVEEDIEDVEVAPIAFRWEDGLEALKTATKPDHGMAEREIELGSPAMATVSLHRQTMSPGFISPMFQTTANAIFAVVHGEGETVVDGEVLPWKTGDMIAVPAWRPYQHRVTADTHIVRASDEALLSKINLLRSQTL